MPLPNWLKIDLMLSFMSKSPKISVTFPLSFHLKSDIDQQAKFSGWRQQHRGAGRRRRQTVLSDADPRRVATTFRQIRSGRIRRNSGRHFRSGSRQSGFRSTHFSRKVDHSAGSIETGSKPMTWCSSNIEKCIKTFIWKMLLFLKRF